ncbi:hypothetical protein D9757_005217 [Collybiopsis confluens]|uniref:Uncharacterized protein n=1 Tax=Collybiopsis confluens TaxID=2823264 RepID=A0A8H5HVN9_9AGAR|nr:hypothetical protein D9757_005217 [Collybiopsis confluens]
MFESPHYHLSLQPPKLERFQKQFPYLFPADRKRRRRNQSGKSSKPRSPLANIMNDPRSSNIDERLALRHFRSHDADSLHIQRSRSRSIGNASDDASSERSDSSSIPENAFGGNICAFFSAVIFGYAECLVDSPGLRKAYKTTLDQRDAVAPLHRGSDSSDADAVPINSESLLQLKKKNAELRGGAKSKDDTIDQLRQKVAELNGELKVKDAQLKGRDDVIREMKAKETELKPKKRSTKQ